MLWFSLYSDRNIYTNYINYFVLPEFFGSKIGQLKVIDYTCVNSSLD